MTDLINRLSDTARPLALVLDDYHLIEQPAIHTPDEGQRLGQVDILVTVTTNVGCVDAAARLRDGDRVIVDGGQGTVEIVSAG